jgi:glyoxylase-like metal-dependent hydrolase (beta-lactamase superfamily II)
MPIGTKKIYDNLYSIRSLFVNSYIYDAKESLIVFDTGISSIFMRLGFKKLGLDYNNVSHVFLTHSDFDHTGGLSLFKKAKIYLSKSEEPMITKQIPRRLFIYNKKIKQYNLMSNLENIIIGDANIKIMYTPGHTIGSVIYIINDKIIISGDTISISRKGKISNFGFLQNMRHKENIETVKKLKNDRIFENIDIIATGHHGILKMH